MTNLLDWLRAHHLLGYTPTPRRVSPATHQRHTDELATASDHLDTLEADVEALSGRQGRRARDEAIAALIAAQARVVDALNGEEGVGEQ